MYGATEAAAGVTAEKLPRWRFRIQLAPVP
jgi:hypothetical protein